MTHDFRASNFPCGYAQKLFSASSSQLTLAAAMAEAVLSTEVRFRPPWPHRTSCGYEAAGITSKPTPFFRILFAALMSPVMRAAARMTGTMPYAAVFDLFVLVATISTGLAAWIEGRDLH